VLGGEIAAGKTSARTPPRSGAIMTTSTPPENLLLSLIAASEDETVPSGILLGTVALPSLDTNEVSDWLESNREYAVYVVPGTEHESQGVRAITVPVTLEDYERVLSAMPR
jgi:hypothetical protein